MSKCKFMVSEVTGPENEFPVSRLGWKQAMKQLVGARHTPGRNRYLTFICPGSGAIPMAQTDHDRGGTFRIHLEGTGGPGPGDQDAQSTRVLAGLRKRRPTRSAR